METPLLPSQAPRPSLPGRLIYQVLAGSHAYGLAGSGSDVDWRGVYLLPTESYLGLHLPGVGTGSLPEAISLEPDQAYHELRHYCRMLLKGNPNPLEWLWLEPRFIFISSPIIERLREMREHFLGEQMLKAYLGWAKAERLGLIAKWDAKAGSHLLRVLLDLRYALVERRLQVTFAGDERELLLAVKRGQLEASDALAIAEEREAECRQLAEAAAWPRVDAGPLEALLLEARRAEWM